MKTPRVVNLLIALMLSAQVEDAWVNAPMLSSTSVAGDDDEYLPADPRQLLEEPAGGHKPAPLRLKLRNSNCFNRLRPTTSAPDFFVAFFPSRLFVFMSLQC